ncbi:MAG: GatB/YqeY domain-containing protein [Candidatus Pacebacteria bacterium]|nr:GatB/YqeY domain-containing protein [Candidatus Paceibacterota bacterium]
MNLKEKIKEELKNGMREKNEVKVSVMKMLLSSINNKEIELKQKETGISEEKMIEAVRAEAKKRRDAAAAYTEAKRDDLARKEKEENLIIEALLPEELPLEEIEKIAKEAVAESKAESIKDFGQAMKVAMQKIKGRASGDKVGAAIKKALENSGCVQC